MLQSRLATLALGVQSAKGQAATEGAFQIGLLGGRVAGAELTEEDLNPTASTRVSQYRERRGVVPTIESEHVGMPRSIGLLLLGACGNLVTTGAGPYEHVFTPGDDLPYLTVWGEFAGNHLRATDCKVDNLELTFDGAGAIRANARFLGLDISFLTSAPDLADDAVERPVDGVIKSTGGQFSIDGATAKVRSGSITFANNVEAVSVATQVLPDDAVPALAEVSFSLTVLPDDLSVFRKVLTGQAAGTAIAPDPYVGSVSFKFVKDSATDLTIAADKAVIATEFPDANPEGGPAEVTVEGLILAPATGDPYTVTLNNDVDAYAS